MLRASFWVIVLNALLVGGLVVLLRSLHPPLLGNAIALTVVLYVVLIPMVAWLGSHGSLFDAWLFLVPLSIFQVVPDWILVQHFGALSFPNLGGGHFGPVPEYMAGLWVAPLLLIVWLGEIVHAKSAAAAVLVVAIASAAVFGAAEWFARPYLLWLAHGVRMWHGIALYVLPAEVLLGLATWLMFNAVHERHILAKVFGAAAVSVFYSGALVVSYFVLERLPHA